VTFDNPYSGLSVSGGTLKSSGANYAVVSMSAAGAVVITGKQYADSTTVYSVNATELPANAKPNVIAVDEAATLVNAGNALEIALRIYAYNQNRYQDEGDIILGNQHVGEVWRMNSLNNRDIVGRVSRLEIDLVTETASVTTAGVSAERVE
jgi:hypothetical protein